jgi:DNA-binding transcriptional MerR regulator
LNHASSQGVGMLLDIADVAQHSGLTASALRYYERRRLIRSSGRNGLRRTFHPDVLSRLALIKCARAAGFTLAQIGRFLVATPGDVELRKQMAQRAKDLDDQIAQLIRMRNSLSHAAICTHKPLVACPKFKSYIEEPRT